MTQHVAASRRIYMCLSLNSNQMLTRCRPPCLSKESLQDLAAAPQLCCCMQPHRDAHARLCRDAVMDQVQTLKPTCRLGWPQAAHHAPCCKSDICLATTHAGSSCACNLSTMAAGTAGRQGSLLLNQAPRLAAVAQAGGTIAPVDVLRLQRHLQQQTAGCVSWACCMLCCCKTLSTHRVAIHAKQNSNCGSPLEATAWLPK